MVNQMTKATTHPRIRRKPKTITCGFRYEETKMKSLRKHARAERCQLADVFRTALDEYIENHNLMEG